MTYRSRRTTKEERRRNRSRYCIDAKVIITLPFGDRCRHRTAEAGTPSVRSESKISLVVKEAAGAVKKAVYGLSGITFSR